ARLPNSTNDSVERSIRGETHGRFQPQLGSNRALAWDTSEGYLSRPAIETEGLKSRGERGLGRHLALATCALEQAVSHRDRQTDEASKRRPRHVAYCAFVSVVKNECLAVDERP